MSSSTKDDLLGKLHRLFRKDRWLNDLFRAISSGIDDADEKMTEARQQFFVDTATDMLDTYERQLDISGAGKVIDDRRAAIMAGWQRGGKVDIYQIQAAANSWKNGATEVDFVDGKIVVRFISEFGVPNDLEGLRAALLTITPAHLFLQFIFKYLLIEDIHEVKTLEQMESLTLEQLGTYTPNKGLYKADPIADAKQTFNITTMLNDNWDKLDEEVQTIADLFDEYGYSFAMTENEEEDKMTIVVTVNENCPTTASLEAVIEENEEGDTVVTVTSTIDKEVTKSHHTMNDEGGKGGPINE